MSLANFKQTAKGAKVGAILTAPASVSRMIELSERDRPAVEAVGAAIATQVGKLDDQERKLVGRWVKEVLAPKGWVPARKGRVSAGLLFSRGTIYRRAAIAPGATVRPRGAARLAAARAVLATMPQPIMSSQELIADRRRDAEREA